MFSSTRQLQRYAKRFCQERMESLVNDASLCCVPMFCPNMKLPLSKLERGAMWPNRHQMYIELGHDVNEFQIALFPPLFACCSTIELFAGTMSGNLKNPNTGKKPQTSPFARYLNSYAGYDLGKSFLLQNVYRHKIAHLSMPAPLMRTKDPIDVGAGDIVPANSVVTWHIQIGAGHHLDLTMGKGRFKHPAGKRTVKDAFRFEIVLDRLLADIVHAVLGKGGYLDALKASTALQSNFEKAIGDLYPI